MAQVLPRLVEGLRQKNLAVTTLDDLFAPSTPATATPVPASVSSPASADAVPASVSSPVSSPAPAAASAPASVQPPLPEVTTTPTTDSHL